MFPLVTVHMCIVSLARIESRLVFEKIFERFQLEIRDELLKWQKILFFGLKI